MNKTKLTVLIIAKELLTIMGAKHVQILMAYDPINDQYLWRPWVDGKAILAHPIHVHDLDLSLNDFSEKHVRPVREMLMGGLGLEQPAQEAPQGCALWAEVRRAEGA